MGEFSKNPNKSKVSLWMLPIIWLWKKTLRLIVPTIFGTLIIVIPTTYIGRAYRP